VVAATEVVLTLKVALVWPAGMVTLAGTVATEGLPVLAAGFGERITDLEEMGRTMGLGPPRRLLLVTLPATRPTLAAASLLGFLVSWSQYGLSLAVGSGLPMLPLVLLPFVRTDPQAAAALSLEFLAPAIAALAVTARAARRPP
jgi:putative spermidine/putrescine transport system permease protein